MTSNNGAGVPGVRSSVDDLQQQIVDIETAVRELEWLRVDTVASAIDALMHTGLPKHKSAAVAGSAAQRREHWALLCLRISETFPQPVRYPNLDLFIYRVALGADDPIEAINLAADNQWSAKELKAWIDAQQGKEPRTSIRLNGTMTWAGGDMVITPHEYVSMEMGEGLEAVAVRAVVTTLE